MYIDYTATRELVGSGLDELETGIELGDRSTTEKTSESVSLSGAGRESQLDRYEFTYSIKTVPVPIADLARWREFHASVLNGETFSLDLWGTKAAPDSVMTASYVPNTFKETRLSNLYYQFSFKVLQR